LLGVCLIGVVSAYPRPQAPGPLQIPGAEGIQTHTGLPTKDEILRTNFAFFLNFLALPCQPI